MSGRFIAGTEDEPLLSNLDIILTGTLSTPDFGIIDVDTGSSGTKLGKKAIGEEETTNTYLQLNRKYYFS